jgi:hypothetical protein
LYTRAQCGRKEWPIDPSGSFHNGPNFSDYFELRDVIASRSRDFARGFTEALFEYALGRPRSFMDEDALAGIVRQAEGKDFEIREFVHALVNTREFQRK